MSDIGEILRSARQKHNLSVADVAYATHIKSQFLEALEDGEYALLPGPAYITGFLRNYARFLGLQPDDIVQEYYATRPAPVPTVKAATRVLANGHESHSRKRVLWALALVAMFFVGGYAIKQYSDSSAHAQPQLNVTPANLGQTPLTPRPQLHRAAQVMHLRLRAISPVWIQVTADGKRVYSGMLRARAGARSFVGHHAIYVLTYSGDHLMATINGRNLGLVARQPGLTVHAATTSGWQAVS